MIQAVIFDMDGLLIDSEPIWKAVEIEEFRAVGVPLTLEMTKQTTGRRAEEVVEYWHRRHPWHGPSRAEVYGRLIAKVTERIKAQGKAKPGAIEAVRAVSEAGLPTAIASSSEKAIIDAVVDKLGLGSFLQLTYSAEHESHGKPHPAVYLTAAQKLGIHPHDCLALEDSPVGVLAAKAANMQCIAVPEAENYQHPYLAIADRVLDSLTDFNLTMLNELANS